MKMLAVNGGAFEWQHVRKWAWLQLFIIVAGALAPAATHPCAFVTDAEQKTVPAVPKPGYLASYVDPVFGQRVTRVTGDPATPVPVVGGTWGTRERHRYSSYAAWNADGSLLLISRHNGDHENLYLDGRTYEVLFERDHGPVGEDDRWHPTDPDLLVYVDDH